MLGEAGWQRQSRPAWFDQAILIGAAFSGIYLVLAPLGGLLLSAFRGPKDFLPFESGARFTFGNFVDVYSDPTIYGGMLSNTLIFTAGTVFLALCIGIAWAWILERTEIPFRNVFFVFLLVPFLIPSIVTAIAWTFLLAPETGLLNIVLRGLLGLKGEGPFSLFSMYGLIFLQGMNLVPLALLLLSATFRSMDPALEEASSACRGRPASTLFRITLPVLAPGILSALIVITILTLEMFDIPLLIGTPAKITVFSTLIFWRLNPSSGLPDYGAISALAASFLILSFTLLAFYNRAIRQSERFATISGKGYRPKRVSLGRWKLLIFSLMCVYVIVTAVLPILVLLFTSFLPTYRPPSPAVVREFSLAQYRSLLEYPDFGPALKNTFIVAVLSASLVASISTIVGWIVVRSRIAGRHLLDFVVFSSVATPSVVAGFAAMILYLTLPLRIYGTLWILVAAYSYRLGISSRIARAGITQIHSTLEEASSVSGAPWRTTFRRILLPLLAPSFLSSWMLVFIVGVREFTLGQQLYNGKENITLGVLLWSLFRQNYIGQAAALSIMMVALILVVVGFVRGVLLKRIRSF